MPLKDQIFIGLGPISFCGEVAFKENVIKSQSIRIMPKTSKCWWKKNEWNI